MEQLDEKHEQIDCAENSKRKPVWIMPLIILAVFIISIFCSHSKLTTSLFFLVLFAVIYVVTVPKAISIAKTGNRMLAMRSLVCAFVPLLLTANTAVYETINSPAFKHYTMSARMGLRNMSAWIDIFFPGYGDLTITVLLAVIAIGANAIIISKFTAVTRAIRKLSMQFK